MQKNNVPYVEHGLREPGGLEKDWRSAGHTQKRLPIPWGSPAHITNLDFAHSRLVLATSPAPHQDRERRSQSLDDVLADLNHRKAGLRPVGSYRQCHGRQGQPQPQPQPR
jgi:hypothetical protein